MNMRIEQRLAALEQSFRPADDRGRCPACRAKISYIDIDDDGNPHCGCGAPLEPDAVPRNTKIYVGIQDGSETHEHEEATP